MSEPIISVSGLRGIIGESLTPDLVSRFACAFAAGLPSGSLVLSRDGRGSGAMLADSVRGSLCAMGRDVRDIGIAATPTAGLLVKQLQAAGGIQISASHNPLPYNGLKLFNDRGQVLTAAEGEPVLHRFRESQRPWVPYDQIGSVQVERDTTSSHLAAVLATVDVNQIRSRKFRVLLDANCGSGSILGRILLESLGCQTRILGGEPNGQFVHLPEPTAENLAEVRGHVTEFAADIGFCQDPDADRLAVIDEQGRYIGEEYTLALCLDHVLRQRPGPIVTNCATSRMAADLADRYGVPLTRSAVGEANVVAAMQACGATFGGEGNGGPIDPRVGFIRDSFVGMALILDSLAARPSPVSQVADALPRYAIQKDKTTLAPNKVATALDAMQRQFADAKSSRLDGLRLDWPDRWLLVRASNTEPIVRIIAEAPTSQDARQLCLAAAKIADSV